MPIPLSVVCRLSYKHAIVEDISININVFRSPRNDRDDFLCCVAAVDMLNGAERDDVLGYVEDTCSEDGVGVRDWDQKDDVMGQDHKDH